MIASTNDQPRSVRGLLIAIGLAVVIAVGGNVLLLGIPGALVLAAASPVLPLVFGPGVQEAIPPDSWWPMALMLTLLWPGSIVAGYVVAYRLLAGRTRRVRHFTFLAILYGWAVLLSIWAVGSAL